MRTVSCCFTTIVSKSLAISVIYSTKFLVVNFVGRDFLAPDSGHHLEHQPFLGPGK